MTWIRGCLVGLMIPALGCASGAKQAGGIAISPDALLAAVPLGGGQEPTTLVDGREMLAVSPAMMDFLSTAVHQKAGSQVRLEELIDAIVGARDFNLEFGEETRTAAETFRLRRGNCLSFSSLFIALARELGLDAAFQEVDIPPDWTMRNDTFVLNRHINATVDLGPWGTRSVDFNVGDFKTGYDRRTISDSRAMAHFFNNLGVESMQAGDTAAAVAYFRRAVTVSDNQFSPAWTNLGTLYMRRGRPEYAEAAYLQALSANRGDEVAMSNLVSVYELQGDSARAAFYRDRVIRHRNQNPYYRFNLAREAYSNQDYDAAIKHLKFAIRKHRNDDGFYALLGMCYLKTGDESAARRWLVRAEKVAATEAEKRGYADTIDLLLEAPR